MKVTAKATRSGDWWAIEVPEVPGVFTQVKRLEQVPAMVADAVALMEDVVTDDVEVDVEIDLPDAVHAALADAKTSRIVAELLEAEATAGFVTAARDLALAGYTFRDIGVVLGVSHQRVGQLLKIANMPDFVFEPDRASIREVGVPKGLRTTVREYKRSADTGRYVMKTKGTRFTRTNRSVRDGSA